MVNQFPAPLPRSLLITEADRQAARERARQERPIYGRRGKLPPSPDDREYRCSCGKFQIRGYMPPGSRVEGWCERCKESVVFET